MGDTPSPLTIIQASKISKMTQYRYFESERSFPLAKLVFISHGAFAIRYEELRECGLITTWE